MRTLKIIGFVVLAISLNACKSSKNSSDNSSDNSEQNLNKLNKNKKYNSEFIELNIENSENYILDTEI